MTDNAERQAIQFMLYMLDPSFDIEAYRADLIEIHKKHMEEMQNGNLPTWRISQPPRLDSYSEEYDVDYLISEQINAARRLRAIIESLAAERPQSARDVAITENALMTIGGKLAFPSTQMLEDMFTPNTVKIIPKDSTMKDSGEITMSSDADIKEAIRVNAAKLGALLQMANETTETDKVRWQVYLPAICREMHIDPRAYSTQRQTNAKSLREQRFDAFAAWLAPLETYMLPINGVFYRVCIIENFNETSETVTLYAPFFSRLLVELMTRTDNHKPQLNRVLHASVANEDNEIAIEVAVFLSNKILNRGKTWNAKQNGIIEYKTTYANIINNCPQFNKALSAIMARPKPQTPGIRDTRTQTYNSKLKRVFETAYRILLEESDLPQQHTNFRINDVAEWEDPTSRKKRNGATNEGQRRIASKRFRIPTKSRITDTLKITYLAEKKDE